MSDSARARTIINPLSHSIESRIPICQEPTTRSKTSACFKLEEHKWHVQRLITSRNTRASSAVAKCGRGLRKAVGGVSAGEATGNSVECAPAAGVAKCCSGEVPCWERQASKGEQDCSPLFINIVSASRFPCHREGVSADKLQKKSATYPTSIDSSDPSKIPSIVGTVLDMNTAPHQLLHTL